MAEAAKPKYDAAISFLVEDLAMAQAVNDQLEKSGLSVFFFPRRQEELAGTDGMETMRVPFLEARVNIVLFRKRWGETPWTRVEEGAIKERCFKGGWEHLMFVQLDSTSTLPKWIPPTHIRFALHDYGLDQLVGAIKLRIQEQGGVIKPLDAAGMAHAVRREADYLAERDRLMRDGHWISQLHNSIKATLGEIDRLVAEINSAQNLNIEFGAQDLMGVLRSGFVSAATGWHQPIFNFVGDDRGTECYLRVAEYSGLLQMPGARGYYIESPEQLKEHKFKVDVGQDRKLIWRLGKKTIPAERLADEIIQIFLELLSRANRGKVQAPHF